MTTTSMENFPFDDNEVLPERVQLKHTKGVIKLDELVFGANRTQLIESLINEHPQKAWLLKRNNSIVGFALGRKGNKYHHVGPVSATNDNDAKMLIAKALKDLANRPIVVDVPYDKVELIIWLTSIGFIRQRDFVRMYRNENPYPGMVNNQYLICGPEFG
jgi:hypothetical protein